METDYKTLRRPKRKLCYLINKESPPKQWTEKMTLGDIDGMFDDLDSSSHDEDINPPSPLLQTFISETNQFETNSDHSAVPQEEQLTIKPQDPQDVLHPSRSPSPEMGIGKNSPFKVHGPIKTSSPIEERLVMDSAEEDTERALVVPQILDFEEAKIDPAKTQNPECEGLVTEKNKIKDSVLESPPSMVTLGKATLSNHKKQVAASCKDNPSVKGTKCKEQQTPVLEDEGTTNGQGNTEPVVSALRQDPELPCPEKNSADERRSSEKDIQSFLQKVKEADKPKRACSGALQALVDVPTPELEDEFLILEDDSPLFIIPCKSSIRKRRTQKEEKAQESSTDKDSLEENNTKDRHLETAQEREGTEKANPKLEKHPVNQKMKKNKEKNEGTGHKNGELSIAEDFLGGDVVKKRKPNKKNQRPRKVQSNEIDKAEEESKDTDSKESDKERRSQKVGKRALKSPEVKSSSKSSKDGKQDAKTSRKKSLKKITNVMQGSEDMKQTQWFENVKGPNENYADAEDLPSLSEESLSKDGEVLGKRKRKPPGQWWLSCPETTEETEDPDSRLTCKKSKQKPSAAVPSSLLVKKDSGSKRRSLKQPVPSPTQKANTTEPKNTKTTKSKITTEKTLNKKKTTQEVFQETGIKQIKDGNQEQDGSAHDVDRVHSSPLNLIQRDLSSGTQVFQRVYQHVSAGKRPKTPRRPLQQLEDEVPEKRTRKPPGSWWLVNGMCEDGDPNLLQSQHLHHKEPEPRKKQKSQSKRSRSPRLGSPRNGNMAVLPKPVGGATGPCLTSKPLVKNPRAIFNDIFTSATETAASTGDGCHNNRRSSHSAEEVSVFMQNLETPPAYQSVNMQKELISGPSSMIQLEQYEENEDLILPSSRVHTALSISDMCGPPLMPLILQPKDKANLKEWFKSLWPAVAPNNDEITPNQFDWYYYQGSAIGFMLDADCGSACIGRILLGSHMKKPLWVDHSATTIFNVLTSSVKVVINSKESCIGAGHCFTVQSGHAYSVQNMFAQPAVLYFTRILAEGSN